MHYNEILLNWNTYKTTIPFTLMTCISLKHGNVLIASETKHRTQCYGNWHYESLSPKTMGLEIFEQSRLGIKMSDIIKTKIQNYLKYDLYLMLNAIIRIRNIMPFPLLNKIM